MVCRRYLDFPSSVVEMKKVAAVQLNLLSKFPMADWIQQRRIWAVVVEEEEEK